MRFHENEKCPVCDKLFTENDDIVICPECGTPHHRECYFEIGKCINNDKHSEGFEYKFETSDSGKASDKGEQRLNPNNVYYKPENESDSSGEDSTSIFDEKIDNKTVRDIATVVSTNQPRFINKFRQNKKVSWNWAGLVFGPYYLLYRKMHKQGLICIIIELIANLLVSGFFVEKKAALDEFVSGYLVNSNGRLDYSLITKLSDAQIAEFTALTNAIIPATMIILGVGVIINIVVALFADRFYRAKVFTILDSVEEKLNNGEDFTLINPPDGAALSKEQTKALILSKLGGTSLFFPLMIVAMRLLFSII